MIFRYILKLVFNFAVFFGISSGMFIFAGGHMSVVLKAAPIYLIGFLYMLTFYLYFLAPKEIRAGICSKDSENEIRQTLARIGLFAGVMFFVLGLVKTIDHIYEGTETIGRLVAAALVQAALGGIVYITALVTTWPQSKKIQLNVRDFSKRVGLAITIPIGIFLLFFMLSL